MKFGNNIKVTWKVEGDCKACKFRQDEAGIKFLAGFNPNDYRKFKTDAVPGKDSPIPSDAMSDKCSYVDRLGLYFDHGVGFYYGELKGKIIFKCTGTDGKSVTQPVEFDTYGVAVLPNSGDPYVLNQK